MCLKGDLDAVVDVKPLRMMIASIVGKGGREKKKEGVKSEGRGEGEG